MQSAEPGTASVGAGDPQAAEAGQEDGDHEGLFGDLGEPNRFVGGTEASVTKNQIDRSVYIFSKPK